MWPDHPKNCSGKAWGTWSVSIRHIPLIHDQIGKCGGQVDGSSSLSHSLSFFHLSSLCGVEMYSAHCPRWAAATRASSWSTIVGGSVVHVKWHLHECQGQGFLCRTLHFNKTINNIHYKWQSDSHPNLLQRDLVPAYCLNKAASKSHEQQGWQISDILHCTCPNE